MGRCHPDKTGKNVTYFKTLKSKLRKRTTLGAIAKRDNSALRTTYNISLGTHTIGKARYLGEQLILPAVEEFLKTDTKCNQDVGHSLRTFTAKDLCTAWYQ